MYARKQDNLEQLFRQGSPRLSTAEEYRQAANSPDIHNDASKFIEEGLEPMLINLECLDMGTHPFESVIDVQTSRSNGHVVLEMRRTQLDVKPDTLIRWK